MNRIRRSDWRALALLWERLADARESELPGIVAKAVDGRLDSKSPYDKAFVQRVDRALAARVARAGSASNGQPLARALEHVPAGILVWDRDQKIVGCNGRGEEILRLPLSKRRGEPVKDAVRSREGFIEGVNTVTKAGKPVTRQAMVINLEDDERTIGYSGAPIPGPDGRTEGWVLLFQDISAYVSA
jgi:PAS domain-containing protein